MAFALKMRRIDRAEIRRRVESAAQVLGLTEVLGKRPRTLSGGQRQRVAMGRAIVRDGVLQQFDRPKELYDRPTNLFVAEFIGSPSMSLVGADIARESGSLVARLGEQRLAFGEELLGAKPGVAEYEGRRVILGIRPEDFEDARIAGGIPESRRLSATIDIREDMGSEIFVHFAVAAPPVLGVDVRAAVGEEAVAVTAEHARIEGSLFITRVDRTSPAREGDRIELAVDTARLHLFDPETGLAVV